MLSSSCQVHTSDQNLGRVIDLGNIWSPISSAQFSNTTCSVLKGRLLAAHLSNWHRLRFRSTLPLLPSQTISRGNFMSFPWKFILRIATGFSRHGWIRAGVYFMKLKFSLQFNSIMYFYIWEKKRTWLKVIFLIFVAQSG